MTVATATLASGRPRALETVGRTIRPGAAVLAGAGPVVLLGFSQGGYPVHVVAGYGVALWWLLLVGLLTRAIPRPQPTALGWIALAAVAALTVWGGVSLTWSADPERGLTELARAIVVGGSLLLGMSAVAGGQARALAGGVLAGLTVIVGAAVLSRLQPDWLPGSATITGEFLPSTRTRLAWPLNYWNTIAAAAAVAIPLALTLATRARAAGTAALAAAPIPVLALGITFTLSRGGILAAVVGIVATLLLTAPRPVLLRTMLAPAIGTAILLSLGLRSSALVDVAGGSAQTEAGQRVLIVALLVTLGVGLVQAGLTSADAARWTPRLPRTSRRTFIPIAVLAGLAIVAVGASSDVGDRVDDGWDRFRAPLVASTIDARNTSERLGSISSNGRYQMWVAATDALEASPLKGQGLGSWESWWNPRRGDAGFVRNAHSQLFELLAEVGLLGGLAFLLLIGAPLAAGLAAAVRRRPALPDAAVVAPPLLAFAIALLVDWHWQVSAFAVAGATLMAIALSRGATPARSDQPSARWPRTVATAGLSLVAVGSIAILAVALIAPQAVDASRDAAARGDLAAAARQADDGAHAARFAASPLLQRALVAEQAGDLPAAAAAARAAAERAPGDWRPWMVLARVQVAQGNHAAAVRAYRHARRLNPRSSLLR